MPPQAGDWPGLGWVGMEWAESDGPGCVGLGWAGWDELDWDGLGSAGMGWDAARSGLVQDSIRVLSGPAFEIY